MMAPRKWKMLFAHMSPGKLCMVERKTKMVYSICNIALSTIYAGKMVKVIMDIGPTNLVVGGLSSARRMEPLSL